jgi:hypothetical protein
MTVSSVYQVLRQTGHGLAMDDALGAETGFTSVAEAAAATVTAFPGEALEMLRFTDAGSAPEIVAVRNANEPTWIFLEESKR